MIDYGSQMIDGDFHVLNQLIRKLRDERDHAVKESVGLLRDRLGIESVKKLLGIARQLRQWRRLERGGEAIECRAIVASSLRRGVMGQSAHRV